MVYELSIRLGQRIGDTLKIRWDHIKDGEYDFTQGKGGKPLTVPLTNRLIAYLANVRKEGLTIVCGRDGRPADYRTVTEEMRKVKDTMTHPDARSYVTHGLRKNATIELYQAGCDDEMVKAVTGHSGAEMLKKTAGWFGRKSWRGARKTPEIERNRTRAERECFNACFKERSR